MNAAYPTTQRSVFWASLLGAVYLYTMLHPSPAHAVRRTSDGFVKRGSSWGRLGLGLGSRTVTDSSTGTSETTVLASTGLGVSYGLHRRLVADLDSTTTWDLSAQRLDQLSVTPGARFFVHPQVYARSAYQALLLSPNDNHLLLLGAGAYARPKGASIFFELNAIAWSRDPVDTFLIPRAGVELAF